MDLRQRALLWGHLIITLPAIGLVAVVIFFRKYLFVPCWPYYLAIGLAFAYQWYTAAMPRWRIALEKRGFSETEIEGIAAEGGLIVPGASSAGLFALHTAAAGLCATYVNLWLAGQLVRWILPLIGQPAPANVLDFYLQHFEVANVVPAFVLGTIMVRKFPALGTWAWFLPSAVILYKLLTFVEPNVSVLTSGDPWRRFTYYFEIQRIAPIVKFRPIFYVSGPDPGRVVEQINSHSTVLLWHCLHPWRFRDKKQRLAQTFGRPLKRTHT